MNTTISEDELGIESKSPGAVLKNIRQQKGFTQEYVATKLHLRMKMIELLEADAYDKLPESVFVKGYLRAYAKLLGIDFQPLLDIFNADYAIEIKPEKTLWQIKPESNKAEKALRWFTALFAMGVLVAVAFWWQQNKQAQDGGEAESHPTEYSANQPNAGVRLTDLSKMQSFFSSNVPLSLKEKKDG